MNFVADFTGEGNELCGIELDHNDTTKLTGVSLDDLVYRESEKYPPLEFPDSASITDLSSRLTKIEALLKDLTLLIRKVEARSL